MEEQVSIIEAQIANLKDVERHLRKSVAEEIGEDEDVTRDQRVALLQKYGLMVPKIDRRVTKPSWMEVGLWKRKQSEWHTATKGMVAPQQSRKTFRRPQPVTTGTATITAKKPSKTWSRPQRTSKYRSPRS